MLRFLFATVLIASTGWSQAVAPPQNVEAALTRAQSLYYEARFVESIAALAPIDLSLQSQPDATDEKIKVKVSLALAHMGLNDARKAKALFKEVCALDSDYTLAPEQFSSKVVAAFEEARTEYREATCQKICDELDAHLSAGDLASFLERMDSGDASCSCLKAAAWDAAELAYREGVKSYQENDSAAALENLRTALKLHPEHELAAQYLELAKSKLRLAADRTLLEWRLKFEAQEFATAAATYRQLRSENLEGAATTQLEEMQSEYRKFLSGLIEPWKQACQSGDVRTMATLRTQATQSLPEQELGKDLLDQMVCAHQKECVWLEAKPAMTRLISQVKPTIPADLQRVVETSAPLTVYAQVRIDEGGNVRVIATQGAHPGIREAVRSAVQGWKFSAARIENEDRCVDTILPIVINR